MQRSFIVLLLALSSALAFAAEPPTKDQPATVPAVTSVPAREDFIIIPLRLYRMKSTTKAEANAEIKDQDLQRILGKVNRIWSYGGIYFGLDSIQDVTADVDSWQKRTTALQKLQENAKEFPEPSEKESAESKEPTKKAENWQTNSRYFRFLIPAKSREFQGFRVYYIHQFDVNGIYYGQHDAIVKETARLRAVPNGIDEPIPRVTAHELGHGLSLPHRQDQVNLMASGTSGTGLNEAEIKQTRAAAVKIPGAKTIADWETVLKNSDPEQPTAKQIQSWLKDVDQLTKPIPPAQVP
jgi:hypothetical protein